MQLLYKIKYTEQGHCRIVFVKAFSKTTINYYRKLEKQRDSPFVGEIIAVRIPETSLPI